MKILVIGCGSIGKRHAVNAGRAGHRVALVDTDSAAGRKLAELLDASWFETLHDAVKRWRPNGVILATPTETHLDLAREVVSNGVPLLIEKPIAHRVEGVARLLDEADMRSCRVFVACNMRYHPGVAALRENLAAVGRPLFVRAHYGSYLPDMRPGADYRQLYCAHAIKGGGVILDAIHEIDYLMWMFGSVATVQCEAARISDLDIDAEDYASLSLRFSSGVRAEIHLDYLQKVKRRGLEVVGTEGTLIWQSEGKHPERCTVRLLSQDGPTERVLYRDENVNPDNMYIRLFSHFVDAISGRTAPILDGRQALEELIVALSAKTAAQNGRMTEIEDICR